MTRFLSTIACVALFSFVALAQIPDEAQITPDGRLIYGNDPVTGFYDLNEVHKIEILLNEPNWFQLLDGTPGRNGTPGVTLIGQVIINDTLELDSVEVSIKGQTSDSRNRSEKKSFSIQTDTYLDQDIMGYDNLNLNCAYEDESGMREVLYYHVTRPFTSALKGNFIDLYINGQSWGPYNNIQQIEGRYISEWFDDNDGTRWRAVAPDGITNPGGPFGTGFSTLNYNGPDSSDYNRYYTLKKTEVDDPWQSLIDACEKLNNLPLDGLYDELKHYIDLDKALWFLAQEITFGDDDSYVHKGGMDYYVYWDITTDRILPMEVDGNSVMNDRYVDMSLFYREDDTQFPLMNRLMQVPEIRQRYLAHVRTILNEHFVVADVQNKIDEFASILDQRVQDDPKKIYSHAQFLAEIDNLKNWVSTRHSNLSNNQEVNRQGLILSEMNFVTDDNQALPPLPNQSVIATVSVSGGEASEVNLYYASGIEGVFDKVVMLDDGNSGDGSAGDGVYGGTIPGFDAQEYVRSYVEAKANDGFETASFFPEGAEHDVFIYQVDNAPASPGDVVINEFMASNDESVQDGNGNFEDWVELYNKGGQAVDLTDYALTDDASNLDKWFFPQGTVIEAGGYLIIWTDDDEEDTTQDEIHASFKLSASGEALVLVNDEGVITDEIEFEEQVADISMARRPNGIGDFEMGEHTFGENNDGTTSVIDNSDLVSFTLSPNPVQDQLVTIEATGGDHQGLDVTVINMLGHTVYQRSNVRSGSQLPSKIWMPGTYMVEVKTQNGNLTHIPLIVQ